MPWKESRLVDEGTRFVARLTEGERTAELWKTGYKIGDRHQRVGLQGRR